MRGCLRVAPPSTPVPTRSVTRNAQHCQRPRRTVEAAKQQPEHLARLALWAVTGAAAVMLATPVHASADSLLQVGISSVSCVAGGTILYHRPSRLSKPLPLLAPSPSSRSTRAKCGSSLSWGLPASLAQRSWWKTTRRSSPPFPAPTKQWPQRDSRKTYDASVYKSPCMQCHGNPTSCDNVNLRSCISTMNGSIHQCGRFPQPHTPSA